MSKTDQFFKLEQFILIKSDTNLQIFNTLTTQTQTYVLNNDSKIYNLNNCL